MEAHLDRINGDKPRVTKLLNDSRAGFEEAASLVPNWPDPYLGLARLYAYELRDVDKLENALRQAERRNHPWGRREKAQLADAHRAEGERLYQQAIASKARPEQARKYLDMAEEHFSTAQSWYQQIPGFGNATSASIAISKRLEKLDDLRDELGDGDSGIGDLIEKAVEKTIGGIIK
jgi:hypothetical protein